MYKSAKLPSSALRHVLRVLLLQPSGPSGGATIKPPGAVKLGVGAELRPAASLGVALGGKWGAGGGRGRVYNYEKDMLGEGEKVEPFCSSFSIISKEFLKQLHLTKNCMFM